MSEKAPFNSCFWHGCPKCYRAPKANKKFWRGKIAGNIRRNNKVRPRLRRCGYSVLTAHECDIAKRPDFVIRKVMRALKNRRPALIH